ncbi:quinone oxidoreductase family protein [Deinococcus multiflagellatus]|uniref:Zinc-binding alcohol dehydrogenase family protein n=1 Tax=Deinococcus multiflagellatus TaxID=1656887 RepID=A0ABW1ZPH7_9DEIO|nr:zinc-binding dehydrogenase [Deinococcus multiflagellatus]MBZ9712714.1 zinc-binding dehydrogenase [Deinococcus multiflagellatus]
MSPASFAVIVEEHGGPEVLRWQARPLPQPGPGQVRVRVEVTGVNYADVLSRRGGYGPGAPLPFVPGLDAAGTVDALGEGVTDLTVGTRVACFTAGGSYATHVLAPAAFCLPLPPGVGSEQAAALVPLSTAFGVLQAAGVQPGETVLIHAAGGGVGHLAVQLARARGARVLAVVGDPGRAEFVRGLGADAVVNRHTQDFAALTLDLTGGRGADVILDSVGGETAERGLGCLARFGRLVTYGHAGGRPGLIPTAPLHGEGRAVIGYSGGTLRQHRPEQARTVALAALEALARGDVRVHTGLTLPLHHAAEAHRRAQAGAVSERLTLMAPYTDSVHFRNIQKRTGCSSNSRKSVPFPSPSGRKNSVRCDGIFRKPY